VRPWRTRTLSNSPLREISGRPVTLWGPYTLTLSYDTSMAEVSSSTGIGTYQFLGGPLGTNGTNENWSYSLGSAPGLPNGPAVDVRCCNSGFPDILSFGGPASGRNYFSNAAPYSLPPSTMAVIFPAPLGTLTSTALPSADIFNQMPLAQVSVAFILNVGGQQWGAGMGRRPPVFSSAGH
jgi:hypothetical protein